MVDAVSNANTIAAANAASGAKVSTNSSSTVDYDAFLQLLVAQLNNQDPTEPTDNAELMSQLASFSAVEQQIQTNEKLNTLLQTSQLGQAGGLINHSVTSADGQISGFIKSVVLTETGVQAILETGERLEIGNGTVIGPTKN